MASEWTKTMLSALLDVKHGFAFKGEHFRDEPPGHILLTPGNFAIGGGFKYDKLKYYDGPVPDEFVLDEGDLLVTMTDLSRNSDTLGYPAVVPRTSGPQRFLHNQRLGKILIADEKKLFPRFLYYLMCSRAYRHEIVASATGTTVRHTSPSRIKQFTASIPALKQQQAIACILGALDDKIELNRRMNRTLEATARAIFQRWFVNFDPVRAKAAGQQPPGLKPDLAALFPNAFEDSELGEIPRGCRVIGLNETGTFLNGLALQKYPPSDGDSLPVIKIAQLRKGSTDGADKASAEIDSAYIVEDGDVLFSWSGSLECVLWTGGRGALNQHLFKVTSDRFSQWFYYLWIHEHLASFRHIAAGKATTMGHIQRHHLVEAKVVVPPPPLLVRADRIIGPLIAASVSRTLEGRALASLRDALLPKLISGELEVEDAERIVGRAL